jgi:hypothetical protein
MPDGKFVVLINAAEGRDDEFNDWYTNQHLADVLRVPGVLNGQRFRRMEQQRSPDQPYKYSAMYDIEPGMGPQIIAELNRRGGTPEMPLTTSIAEPRYVGFFEAITSRVAATANAAPRFLFIVMTNAVEGRDGEFNEWYDNTHIPDLLRVPGIVAAQRFRLLPTQRTPNNPWKYLCIYECDAEHPGAIIPELVRRGGTAEMTMSTSLADPRFGCFLQPITGLVPRAA